MTTATLADRIETLLDDGQAGAACLLLEPLARDAPDDGRVLALRTRAALAQGRTTDAVGLLDRALALDAAPALSWRSRAACRLALGHAALAAGDAAEAVVRDPRDHAAVALLGRALFASGRIADARTCLASAVAAAPGDLDAMEALAQAHVSFGDEPAALALIAAATARHPRAPAPRRALAALHTRAGRFAEAAAAVDAAGADGALDATLLGLKGHALACLGDHAGAARAHDDARSLAPDDATVRHMAASAGAGPAPDRASAGYLRTVFDGYAARFEAHLIALGIRIPGLLRAALLDAAPAATGGGWLDLGCGTGLLAVAVSDLPLGPATGVDLSPAMLAQAAAKGLYATLVEADIVDWLADWDARWPLAMAADTLCYFGNVSAVLGGVADRLSPGAFFLFSVERLDGDTPAAWALGRGGRYAHAAAPLRAALDAAGFDVVAMTEETLRTEGGAPVPGLIVTARRRP